MSLRSAPCSQGLLVFQHDSGKLENEKTLGTIWLTVACMRACASFTAHASMTPAVTLVLIRATSSPFSFSNIPAPYWKTRRPWGWGCSFGHLLLIEDSRVMIARSDSQEDAGKHSNGREGGGILSSFLLSAFLSSVLHFSTLSAI